MNKKKPLEEDIISVWKRQGLEEPSEEFSNNLVRALVSGYKKNKVVEYTAGKWLGKFIIAVLVIFNLLFFYYLNPFYLQPVLFISITAFVLGCWIIIALVKRFNSIPL